MQPAQKAVNDVIEILLTGKNIQSCPVLLSYCEKLLHMIGCIESLYLYFLCVKNSHSNIKFLPSNGTDILYLYKVYRKGHI